MQENIDLKPLSYMKIGGQGKYLIEVEHENDLRKVFEIKAAEKLPIVILGEGSNTIFSDNFHNKVFVKINLTDIIKTYEDTNAVNIEVGAGCNWDDLVEWSVKNKFSGLESLSGIPGSVGASPIQNIGAYGSEVSETITHVKIYDLSSGKFYEVSNIESDFRYRDSIFKRNLGEFIITSVSFRLSKKEPEMPTYKDVSLYFLSKKKKYPTLKEIRDAVLEIRSNKLPNPEIDPNCGSFFKNPILLNEELVNIVEKFPLIPQYKFSDTETKLSGGWLIEMSGFKGKKFENIRVSDKNALVLISNGKAGFNELEDVIKNISDGVMKNFGVKIEVEPNFII